MNHGDGMSTFWDSTSQGGESTPSPLLLSASEARGIYVADRDRDASKMFPSPDQDSHRLQTKRPKT